MSVYISYGHVIGALRCGVFLHSASKIERIKYLREKICPTANGIKYKLGLRTAKLLVVLYDDTMQLISDEFNDELVGYEPTYEQVSGIMNEDDCQVILGNVNQIAGIIFYDGTRINDILPRDYLCTPVMRDRAFKMTSVAPKLSDIFQEHRDNNSEYIFMRNNNTLRVYGKNNAKLLHDQLTALNVDFEVVQTVNFKTMA